MTGISLILVGAVALSNIGLLFYLLTERNRALTPPSATDSGEKKSDADTGSAEQRVSSPGKRPHVGKSRTVIDNLEKYIQDLVDERLRKEAVRLHMSLDGEVRPQDVEFRDSPDEGLSTPEGGGDFIPHARMSKEEEKEAFDDIRIEDIDGDFVSAPSASGTSFDEIEKAFDTAARSDATAEEKAIAGDIFDKLMDTGLMDMLASDEEIMKGVKACVSESIRIQFTEETPKKVKAVVRNKTTVLFPEKPDDFNPEDVFSF